MHAPRVSVLMPAYNCVLYVREAIASIRAQSYRDFELIIIDGASTDGTPEVCLRAIAGDPRCRLISSPGTGVVGARNDGFAASRGTDYIAAMDADDVAEPDRFTRQIQYLDSHPDCVVVGCRVLAIDQDGDPICYLNNPLDHTAIESLLFQGQGGTVCQPAAMIRRNAYEQVNGYQPEFPMAEDLNLYLRLGEIGKLANLPDMLLRYRLHGHSANVSKGRRNAPFVQAIIENAYKRRGLAGGPPPPINYLSSALEVRTLWGYQAVAGRNYRTALKHALPCVAQRPWKLAWWRLLGAAIKGLLRGAYYPCITR